jgi:hypothetical protein
MQESCIRERLESNDRSSLGRRARSALSPLGVYLISASCLSGSQGIEPLARGGIHVLFVGNSLTYVNDLPATVAAIAALASDTLRVSSAVGANLGIIDHLTGGSTAVDQLRRERWNWVVLQQGPTPAGVCRDSLVLWTKQFAPLIESAGAKPVLLMTWPGVKFQNLFDEVRVSFQAASVGVGGMFVPAGEAWRGAWVEDSTLALYGPDGFHPSPIGTFLTALVVYERITGRDVRTLPARAFASGRELALPNGTITLLQRAAHEANVRYSATSAPTPEELQRPSLFVMTSPRC